jgi:hypothetical protein
MRSPACTEPVFAVTYEIIAGDKPVPVSPAGYCLKVDEQYRLLVHPYSPSVKIQQVLIRNSQPVEVHESRPAGADFEVRFKVKDNGWTFLPFRFLRGMHTLRVEMTTESGSREVRVPVVMVNFLSTFFTGSSPLWTLATGVAFVLSYLLGVFNISWLEFRGSQFVVPAVSFVLLYSTLLIVALSIQHSRLAKRVRKFRRGLDEVPDEADGIE